MQNNRYGTFSSSSVWKLLTVDRKGTGWGAPALKYIKQVSYEIELGRALNPDRDSRATMWGTLVEYKAFEHLGLDYSPTSQTRVFHPDYPFWSGATDVLKEDSTGDIKCPFSLEVFCDKIKALQSGLEVYKNEYPEDYWQHGSNCILNNQPFFEPIIYVPYQSELESIRAMAGLDESKYKWITYAEDKELPYLLDSRKQKNLNIFRFEFPKEDKEFLTAKIIEAGKLLNA